MPSMHSLQRREPFKILSSQIMEGQQSCGHSQSHINIQLDSCRLCRDEVSKIHNADYVPRWNRVKKQYTNSFIPGCNNSVHSRGRFRIFRRGGHTLIERAISYHFSQKGYHVRACTTGTRGHPRRAVPCREQSGDETI